MTERNSIIGAAQKISYVDNNTMVAAGIGYGWLYTPVTNMIRCWAEIRWSGWIITPQKCL